MRKIISIKENNGFVSLSKYEIDKEKANQCFRNQKYEEALDGYKRILEGLGSELSESSESRGKKLSTILSNCIITYLKLGNTDREKKYRKEVEDYSNQLEQCIASNKEYISAEKLKKYECLLNQAKLFLEDTEKVKSLQSLCKTVADQVRKNRGIRGVEIIKKKTKDRSVTGVFVKNHINISAIEELGEMIPEIVRNYKEYLFLIENYAPHKPVLADEAKAYILVAKDLNIPIEDPFPDSTEIPSSMHPSTVNALKEKFSEEDILMSYFYTAIGSRAINDPDICAGFSMFLSIDYNTCKKVYRSFINMSLTEKNRNYTKVSKVTQERVNLTNEIVQRLVVRHLNEHRDKTRIIMLAGIKHKNIMDDQVLNKLKPVAKPYVAEKNLSRYFLFGAFSSILALYFYLNLVSLPMDKSRGFS